MMMVPLRLAAILVASLGEYKHPKNRATFDVFRIPVTWTMINIIAVPDSALSRVNFARDFVQIRTIFMVCKTTLSISAGLLISLVIPYNPVLKR